jgi:hypothetical protein
MPELNGIEVLREARQRLPGARRVLVSGRIDGEVEPHVLAEADVDGGGHQALVARRAAPGGAPRRRAGGADARARRAARRPPGPRR